ncbi:Histidine kinase 4 [Glycine soja]
MKLLIKFPTKCTFIQAHRAWLPKFLVLWILLMALIGCFIYKVLGSLCDQRARMLQDQFSVKVNHVHALSILVSTFHYYRTPSTIDQSIQLGQHLNDHYSMGVAYAQRVVNSERGTFEKQHGWVIKTIEREPSLVRDEYAPMIFAQETISYLESLDMMFRDDRENIFMARATRKVVLTSPFNLLGSHHLGVVLTFPVYKSKLPPKPTMEECIKATVGYVGGSFDVESLMENLVGQLTGHEAILVNVYDIKNSTNPLIMYGNQNKEGDMSLVHESKLDFGDPYGNHTIICRYHQKAPTNWITLTTKFLFFWAIIYMVLAGNHIVKVKDDFHQMEELKVRAEVANVAKSEFLAIVSHEIKTLMNGILASESYEQVTLMVSMEGTGIGIPFLAKDRIFMPFVQADNSTSQHYGGTGIGLSFSKCLVKLISGEISFISQLQVGSTFSFTVDFGTIDKNAITDMKKHNLEDLPPNFRWLKAIVVDGKPIRASVTGYHLKRLGIQAKVANIMNKVAKCKV